MVGRGAAFNEAQISSAASTMLMIVLRPSL
jgi:hypothetical protein